MREVLCVCTCDVDLSGVTALTPPVAGDNGPTAIGIGGLLGVPLNTSSSFCVNCANPCVAVQVETIVLLPYKSVWLLKLFPHQSIQCTLVRSVAMYLYTIVMHNVLHMCCMLFHSIINHVNKIHLRVTSFHCTT